MKDLYVELRDWNGENVHIVGTRVLDFVCSMSIVKATTEFLGFTIDEISIPSAYAAKVVNIWVKLSDSPIMFVIYGEDKELIVCRGEEQGRFEIKGDRKGKTVSFKALRERVRQRTVGQNTVVFLFVGGDE